MSRSTKDPIQQQLVALANRLSDEITKLEGEALQPTGGESSGGLSDVPVHIGDLGSREFEEEVSLALVRQKEHLLAEVNAALERCDRGTFGRCEACAKAIDRARLHAVPYARRCAACARKEEEQAMSSAPSGG